ncbi:MAG: hypothetical protein NVSMB1_15670 [Polyangiales bacterium]
MRQLPLLPRLLPRTTLASLWGGLSLLTLAACTSPRTRSEYDEVVHDRGQLTPAAVTLDQLDQEEASLRGEAPLDSILRLAMAHNPDLSAAKSRVEAALAKARAAGRLPDLELKYELWGQPLSHPVSFGEAQTHMLGLRQTFPALGSLDAKSRVAGEEARIELETAITRQQDVIGEVRSTYAAYFGASRERTLHLEHIKVGDEMVQIARANYAAGKGTQQDVLRVMVQLSQVHADFAEVDARVASSKALLNTLMGRALDAPLGPPSPFDEVTAKPKLDELERSLKTRRPEIATALAAVRKSEASLDDAKSRADWPTLMVGADYWYMPVGDVHHAYGAMVSMTLPWLNPSHREEVSAARESMAADKAALDSIARAIAYQLRDATTRLEAARERLAVIDRDLMPQAQKSFETARAAFSVGGGDALGVIDAMRSYVQVRLDRERAIARVASTLANVERAAGIGIERSKGSAR